MARLILIGGGTGSGKSTIAKKLKEKLFHLSVAVFSHDHYYRDLSLLSSEECEKYNFDHPDAIDSKNLVADLKRLLKGQEIEIPIYDYSTHKRDSRKITIPASDIIIIEGIFALYYNDLLSLADIKIFVDADPEIRLKRRIERDCAERGYSPERTLCMYNKNVRPMHDLFVEPTARKADIVVCGTDHVDKVSQHIINKLNELGFIQ